MLNMVPAKMLRYTGAVHADAYLRSPLIVNEEGSCLNIWFKPLIPRKD
jgi:hypothetical protein